VSRTTSKNQPKLGNRLLREGDAVRLVSRRVTVGADQVADALEGGLAETYDWIVDTDAERGEGPNPLIVEDADEAFLGGHRGDVVREVGTAYPGSSGQMHDGVAEVGLWRGPEGADMHLSAPCDPDGRDVNADSL
jgi:hypothetical protein